MDTSRLFIAFQLPADLQQHLSQVQNTLQKLAPHDAFRWINPSNTHITLHFLGDVPHQQVDTVIACIKEGCSAAAAAVPAEEKSLGSSRGIRCRLGGLGYFSHIDKPRVVWMGLNEMTTRHTVDLHARGRVYYQQLEKTLAVHGITSDSPRYAPHITLGYRRRQSSRAETAAVTASWQQGFHSQGLIFSINSIVLFESVVGESGREHRALYSEKLTGTP